MIIIPVAYYPNHEPRFVETSLVTNFEAVANDTAAPKNIKSRLFVKSRLSFACLPRPWRKKKSLPSWGNLTNGNNLSLVPIIVTGYSL
jgi:hypothetical protein